MHRNKRFAWTWAAAGVFAVAGLIGACDPEETSTPDAGTKVDAGTTTDAGADAGTTTDAGTDAGTTTDAGTDAGTTTDAGTDAGPQSAFPLAVDGTWAASGYMGAGSQPGGIVDEAVCATPRPGAALGNCHKITATRVGTGDAWAGIFWQYPEGNWPDKPEKGFLVPDGAKSVSFYAWGGTGGEVVDFFVGYGDKSKDGFEKKINVTLTKEPTKYTLDISRVRYTEVAAGFGWSAGGLDVAPLVLFLDDIQWH
ncbi:hypothetical protein [Corallococcus llansteffanensis]|uniref:Lipoprotein n=1 Tax=Corallococcus llansteffanensis TaxID=2316731 RepID=A0A3A8QE16_9BACT|nr:hypothetical protein [Corallococcus llansteffanensis]RKH66959.1 hypothetical protein D7V93_03685 [Corallococcus llansteffanensis]